MVVSIRSAYDSSVNYILQKLEPVNITSDRNALQLVGDTASMSLLATYHFMMFGIQSLPLAFKLAISSIPSIMAKQVVAQISFPNEQDVLGHKARGLAAITRIRSALTGASKSRSLANLYQRLEHNVIHHYQSDDPMVRTVVLNVALTTLGALATLAIGKSLYENGYWGRCRCSLSYPAVHIPTEPGSHFGIKILALSAFMSGGLGLLAGEFFDTSGKHAVLQGRIHTLHTNHTRAVQECRNAIDDRDRTTAELTQTKTAFDQARTQRNEYLGAMTHIASQLNRTTAELTQTKTALDQARTQRNEYLGAMTHIASQLNQTRGLVALLNSNLQQVRRDNQRLTDQNTGLRAAFSSRQVAYHGDTHPIRLTAQQSENLDDVCKHLDLRCGITKNTYDNPVIVETGLTYEDGEIRRHFSANAIFPTGEPISGTVTLVPNGMIRDLVGLVRLAVLLEPTEDPRQAVHNVLSRLPDLPFRDPVVLMEDLGRDYPSGMTMEREQAELLRTAGTRAVPFVPNLALKGYIDQLRGYKEQNPDGPPAVRQVRTAAEAVAAFRALRQARATQPQENVEDAN